MLMRHHLGSPPHSRWPTMRATRLQLGERSHTIEGQPLLLSFVQETICMWCRGDIWRPSLWLVQHLLGIWVLAQDRSSGGE